MPACNSCTLTNVLPHRNTMPQAQDTKPHPVIVYRHMADMSLCYPLMWNVIVEYSTIHFNVLGQTRLGNPCPTFHTHQRTLNSKMLLRWLSVRSSVESVPCPPSLQPGICSTRIHYAIRSPTTASFFLSLHHRSYFFKPPRLHIGQRRPLRGSLIRG